MSENPDSEARYAELRDALGRVVREEWVAWAREQPDPKPSWLVPYDELPEGMKEADRRIGEGVTNYFSTEVAGGRVSLAVIVLDLVLEKIHHLEERKNNPDPAVSPEMKAMTDVLHWSLVSLVQAARATAKSTEYTRRE